MVGLETAREAAELAKTKWVRLAADMGLGGYRIYQAEGELSEPEWPDKPLTEIMQIAFRDRIVDTENHPVVRRLAGVGVMRASERQKRAAAKPPFFEKFGVPILNSEPIPVSVLGRFAWSRRR